MVMGAGTVENVNVAIGATDTATPVIHGLIRNFGKLAVAAGAVAGVAIFGKKSLDAFADFDKAITNSLTMFDNLDETMRVKMTKAARELSTQIPRSASDVAEAFYWFGSAGLEAADALEALPVVGKFAVANNISMAESAQNAASLMKLYNISVEDLEANLDVTTKGMKSALMTMTDMNEV